MRWLWWAAALGLAAGGVALGLRLLGSEVRLTARGSWRPISEGLRRAGRDDVLSVGPDARLRLDGLRPSHVVRLKLASRADEPPRDVRVSCGSIGTDARLAASMASVELRDCRIEEIRLQADLQSPARPYHLHEVVVARPGIRLLAFFPAAMGLAVFAWRRRQGSSRALLWSLAAATAALPLAFALDPLARLQLSRASQDRVFWTLGLLTAVAAWAEPRWRATLPSAVRWLREGGLTGPKVILACGLALGVATVLHAAGLNGPRYWRWTWRELDPRVVFPLVIAAAAPFFAARALFRRQAAPVAACLALMAAGVVAVSAAALSVQPSGLARFHAVIESPGVTGYFTDAEALVATPGWLATYPARLWRLHTHSRTKPPGPVVFHAVLIRLLGTGSVTAAVGGLLILLAAAAAVPAVYALAREWGSPPDAAFEAAGLMAWSPGLLLFLPEFDQTFPLVTCAVLIAWSRAVRTGRLAPALAFGALAAGVFFFSYSFLVLGLAGLVIARSNPRSAARAAAVAVVVVLALYALLFLATGFDPIATFRTALDAQRRLSVTWGRRYWPAILYDPVDFALGAGWIAALLALVAAVRAVRTRERDGLLTLGAIQIAGVDLSGVLRVEAARVWLLLTPFVMVPAGRELARWSQAERTAGYVLMAVLLAAITGNMTFIDLGPAP